MLTLLSLTMQLLSLTMPLLSLTMQLLSLTLLLLSLTLPMSGFYDLLISLATVAIMPETSAKAYIRP